VGLRLTAAHVANRQKGVFMAKISLLTDNSNARAVEWLLNKLLLRM
jgi:hypothetical protein